MASPAHQQYLEDSHGPANLHLHRLPIDDVMVAGAIDIQDDVPPEVHDSADAKGE